mmetsp:Transcript_32213/g.75918  ORF Transcript_32213/g.75918 Transcript_32213/m.75918 type:complete len:202 (+) Transcript_32213:641-1246(+)
MLESLVIGKADQCMYPHPVVGVVPPQNRFISDSGSVLAAALSGCKLRHLEVNEDILYTEDGQQLAAVLPEWHDLEEFTMQGCYVLPEAATTIAPALAKCVSLRKVCLDFNHSHVNGEIAQSWDLLLPGLQFLEEVVLHRSLAFEEVRFELAVTLLKECRQLKALTMPTRAPTEDEINECLAALTECDGRLKTLSLRVETWV